jgi:hypothetical protein
MSCVTFWVILRRMVFNSRRFGTQWSKLPAIKLHTPENNPKDYTRHSEHGESLKSRKITDAIHIDLYYYSDQSYASSGDYELCRMSSGWMTSPSLSEFGGS